MEIQAGCYRREVCSQALMAVKREKKNHNCECIEYYSEEEIKGNVYLITGFYMCMCMYTYMYMYMHM